MSNETKNESFAKGIRELAEMALSTARVMDDEAARDEIEAELRQYAIDSDAVVARANAELERVRQQIEDGVAFQNKQFQALLGRAESAERKLQEQAEAVRELLSVILVPIWKQDRQNLAEIRRAAERLKALQPTPEGGTK